MESVKAKFILEAIGRPAEHLTNTLNELVNRISQDKGISVISKEIHKPKTIEKVENLWSSFADVEIEFQNVQHFFNAVIMYMPAHVEVFHPENLRFDTFELNELANFIVGRLHNYDAIAKKLMGEREILINKLEYIRKGGKIEEVFKPVQTNQNNIDKSKDANKESRKIKKSKKKN
jgi:hypothetical protein